MLDFQQKRKVRSFMYNKKTLIVLSVLVLVVIHSTWRVYQKKIVSEEMKNISIAYTESLRERSEELKEKIDRLETIPGIEEEIRSRFSVVKGEENMVVIVNSDDSEVVTTSSKLNLWQKIKLYLWAKD